MHHVAKSAPDARKPIFGWMDHPIVATERYIPMIKYDNKLFKARINIILTGLFILTADHSGGHLFPSGVLGAEVLKHVHRLIV